jgi:hypothetical protein
MPRVSFEPTTPVLERAKTVHALGRAATVIGTVDVVDQLNQMCFYKFIRLSKTLGILEHAVCMLPLRTKYWNKPQSSQMVILII